MKRFVAVLIWSISLSLTSCATSGGILMDSPRSKRAASYESQMEKAYLEGDLGRAQSIYFDAQARGGYGVPTKRMHELNRQIGRKKEEISREKWRAHRQEMEDRERAHREATETRRREWRLKEATDRADFDSKLTMMSVKRHATSTAEQVGRVTEVYDAVDELGMVDLPCSNIADLPSLVSKWSSLRLAEPSDARYQEAVEAAKKLEACRQKIGRSKKWRRKFCEIQKDALKGASDQVRSGFAAEGYRVSMSFSGPCSSKVSISSKDFETKDEMRGLVSDSGIEEFWVHRVIVSNGSKSVTFEFDQPSLENAAMLAVDQETGVWRLPE